MAKALAYGQTRQVSEHLRELGFRVAYVMAALFACSALTYHYRDILLRIIINPLHQSIYYTNPAGGLTFTLDLSLLFGLILTLPVAIFNVVKFLLPALPVNVQPRVFLIVISSFLLAMIGACSAYLITLPAALHFLGDFQSSQVQSLISADSYLSLTLKYLAGFALIFQLPLIMLFVHWIRPLSLKALWGFERWIILVSFILAAILNPAPDPLDQALTALPVVAAYQLGIILIILSNRPKKERQPLPIWKLFLICFPLGLMIGIGIGYLATNHYPVRERTHHLLHAVKVRVEKRLLGP